MRAVEGRGIEVGCGGKKGEDSGVRAIASVGKTGLPGVSGRAVWVNDVASTAVLLTSWRRASYGEG